MNDPAIAPIFKAKEKGARLSKDEVKGLGPESRRLDEQWNLLTIQSSRLYRQNTKQPTLQAVYSLRWRQYQAAAGNTK